MRRARIAFALALVAGAGSGCAGISWHWLTLPWTSRPRRQWRQHAGGERGVTRPRRAPRGSCRDGRAGASSWPAAGKPLAARELYERVVRDYPDDPARAGALFGLGLLYADPAGPLRDYRGSYATFGRLLAEHPRSRWDADAKLWRATLNELLVREEETARLRSQLQRLKRIEVELDRR